MSCAIQNNHSIGGKGFFIFSNCLRKRRGTQLFLKIHDDFQVILARFSRRLHHSKGSDKCHNISFGIRGRTTKNSCICWKGWDKFFPGDSLPLLSIGYFQHGNKRIFLGPFSGIKRLPIDL